MTKSITTTTKKTKLLTSYGVVKLSKTSKMGCYSWSLQAIEHCPASLDKDGGLVPVCQNCYATRGNYVYSNVKKVRQDNWLAWREESFVSDFVTIMHSGHKFHRYMDSGDLATVALAEKIYQICLACPDTKFWIPTRMSKFKKFEDVLARLSALPNVALRHSGDNYDELLEGKDLSSVVTTPEFDYSANPNVFKCVAPLNNGACGDCRTCWSKQPVIAYEYHGVSIKKVMQLKEANSKKVFAIKQI